MKLIIWIEILPVDIGNNGEFRQDPSISTRPFLHACSDNIQRFRAVIDIPYVIKETKEAKVKFIEEI